MLHSKIARRCRGECHLFTLCMSVAKSPLARPPRARSTSVLLGPETTKGMHCALLQDGRKALDLCYTFAYLLSKRSLLYYARTPLTSFCASCSRCNGAECNSDRFRFRIDMRNIVNQTLIGPKYMLCRLGKRLHCVVVD